MPPPAPLTTGRKLLFGLLLTLLAVLAAEGLLRQLLGPPPPAVRVFGALQDQDHWFTEVDGQVTKTYAPTGISPDPSFPAHYDGQRVAAIGESSMHMGTEGLAMAFEFPGLLEQQLGVPVVNLASPGLDSFDLVHIVEQLAPYEFSALLVYAGHNDTGNAWFQQRYGTVGTGIALRARVLLDRLYLFGGLRRLISDPEGGQRREGSSAGNLQPQLDETQRAEAARMFQTNLDRIVWLAHDRGMAVVLATPICRLDMAPLDEHCDAQGRCAAATYQAAMEQVRTDRAAALPLFELARDLDGKPLRAPSAIATAVREVAAQRHTWLVDLAHEVPQDAVLPVPHAGMFADFIHLSPDGHKVFADLLAPALREALAAQAAR